MATRSVIKEKMHITDHTFHRKRYALLTIISPVAMNIFILASVYLLLTSFSLFAAQKNEQGNNQKKLSQVKQAITAKKDVIKQVNLKRQKLLEQLKTDDINIAKTATSLALNQRQLEQTKNKINQLNSQQKKLEQQTNQQQKLLSAQLRAAFATGNHDYLKLILNQQNPKEIERTLVYYRYLNQARLTKITEFKQTMQTLTTVVIEQQQQALNYQQLQTAQQQKKTLLLTNKKTRKQTIVSLNKQLFSNKQSLEQLEIEEASLAAAINRLIYETKKALDLDGLAQLKRKLSWPIPAKINRSFGSQKQGHLSWKGVLMKAPEGQQVNTIHHGNVLFADWLKGYGLVTIIDHGKGYMSLYGHNQALLKSVGDRVETGEPIALVGQSGGQSQSALYFEIRHNGAAVNPKLWCQ
jgi:septal ring factor EnvC (AmiA/AmiB activator)